MSKEYEGLKVFINGAIYITAKEIDSSCKGCAFDDDEEEDSLPDCETVKALFLGKRGDCQYDNEVIYKLYDPVKGKKKLLIL